MQTNKLITMWRISWGVLIFLSIATQIILGNYPDSLSVWNFFSYFTVLSNLLMASLFVTLALNRCDPKELDYVRGATTLYMIFTGLGFAVLLKGDNQELLWWVNILLHYLTPVAMLLDWLWIKSSSITFLQGIKWLIPSIVYLIYTYLRAALTGWYPYTFLNPQLVGFTGVGLYIVGLLGGGLALIYVLSRTTLHTKHH